MTLNFRSNSTCAEANSFAWSHGPEGKRAIVSSGSSRNPDCSAIQQNHGGIRQDCACGIRHNATKSGILTEENQRK